jgi:hypothetical protein
VREEEGLDLRETQQSSASTEGPVSDLIVKMAKLMCGHISLITCKNIHGTNDVKNVVKPEYVV